MGGAWLLGDSSSRVPTPNANSDAGLRVVDLIDNENACWRVDVLKTHLMAELVSLI